MKLDQLWNIIAGEQFLSAMKTAIWDGQVYRCGQWVSADGDEWFFGTVGGEPVAGTEFAENSILLAGGPRDRTVVF